MGEHNEGKHMTPEEHREAIHELRDRMATAIDYVAEILDLDNVSVTMVTVSNDVLTDEQPGLSAVVSTAEDLEAAMAGLKFSKEVEGKPPEGMDMHVGKIPVSTHPLSPLPPDRLEEFAEKLADKIFESAMLANGDEELPS